MTVLKVQKSSVEIWNKSCQSVDMGEEEVEGGGGSTADKVREPVSEASQGHSVYI